MSSRAWLAVLLGAVVLAGAATLPRQLPLLAASLAEGPPHAGVLLAGLRRWVVIERLVPPPTPLLAAGITWVLAAPWLPEGPAVRRLLLAVMAASLVPLLVQRIGEAAVVWLTPAAAVPRAGDVVQLPRLFSTGPALLVPREAVRAPLDLLDARLNLVTLAVLAVWALGLRRCEGTFAGWQLAVPVVALLVAGACTWWLGPLALALVVRGV